MLATSCYTREELERYLHGWADDDLSSAIERHLESCSSCEDTFSELDASDDTLIRTLQVKGGSQHAHAPAWVEQLANMIRDGVRWRYSNHRSARLSPLELPKLFSVIASRATR